MMRKQVTLEHIADEATEFMEAREYTKKSDTSIWMPEEIDCSKDRDHIRTLPSHVSQGIKRIIDFFANVDAIVVKNIDANFVEDFPNPHIQSAYRSIEKMEEIHTISYRDQLRGISETPEECEMHMHAYKTVPSIRAIAEFAEDYANAERYSLVERVVAYFGFEGVIFTGAFSFLFWVKKTYPGLLPGIIDANNFISRDENLHCEFASYLLTNVLPKMGHTVSTEILHRIFTQVVALADTFVEDFLQFETEDISPLLMKQHIRHVANVWLAQVGASILFPGTSSPFSFVENIVLQVKNNFFEQRSTVYQKYKTTSVDWEGVLESFRAL